MRLFSYRSSGNCLKVRMLLGALGLDCELVEVDIFAGETLTDDFERLNPLRETPVLELDDGSALSQSNAILQYLAEGTAWAGRSRLERAQAAGGAGVDLSRWPGVTRWTERVLALPGIVDDWVPYPDNARPGRGRSIY